MFPSEMAVNQAITAKQACVVPIGVCPCRHRHAWSDRSSTADRSPESCHRARRQALLLASWIDPSWKDFRSYQPWHLSLSAMVTDGANASFRHGPAKSATHAKSWPFSGPFKPHFHHGRPPSRPSSTRASAPRNHSLPIPLLKQIIPIGICLDERQFPFALPTLQTCFALYHLGVQRK